MSAPPPPGPKEPPHCAVLTGGQLPARANLLLELNEQLAEGKPVPQISDVCRLVIAPATAEPVIKRLAYDAVRLATLTTDDWGNVCRGLAKDVSKDQPMEVLTRALEVLPRLPELQLQHLADVGDLENKLITIVHSGSVDVQSYAVVALAHLISCPVIACSLFADRKRLESTLARWVAAVAHAAASSVPRVTHGALVAVDHTFKAWQAAVRTRDVELNERLVAVLSYFAWAGAARLRALAAHILAQVAAMPSSLQAESVTSLTELLSAILTNDAPARLTRDGKLTAGASVVVADTLEVEQGWIYSAFGSLCVQLLESQDAATVSEAARAVLHLRSLESVQFPRFHVAPTPDHWMHDAVAALLRTGAPLDDVLGRETAAGVLCRYLAVLPPADVLDTVRVILPWILQRSSASSRVSNLMLMWRAVVDVDLSSWRRPSHAGDTGHATPQNAASTSHATPQNAASTSHAMTLISLLDDPLVRALRADSLKDPSAVNDNTSPTLSQEVVSTLLEVLLTHEEASAAIGQAIGTRNVSSGLGNGDLQDSIKVAALLDARRTSSEWSQIALVALQGTQGCLGWDTGAAKRAQGTYPATVTADKWFVLALRTQHVLRALRSCKDMKMSPAEAAGSHLHKILSDNAEIGVKLATADQVLQGMFLKILRFWRSLSKPAAPRALWVLTHHLRMPAVHEELWTALFEALREVLLYQPGSTAEMHTQELEMSTRNGALPYSAGAQGVRASERPLLVGGQLLHLPEAADWWDVCAAGQATGLLVLDRVSRLLWINYAEHANLAGYHRIVRAASLLADQLLKVLPRASGQHGTVVRLHETLQGIVDVLPSEGHEIPLADLYVQAQRSEAPRPAPARGSGAGESTRSAMPDGSDGAAPPEAVQSPRPGRTGGAPPPRDAADASQAAEDAASAALSAGQIVKAPAAKGSARSSSYLVSGAKGFGNALGLRKKKTKTPMQMIADVEQAGAAKELPPPPPKAAPKPTAAAKPPPPPLVGINNQDDLLSGMQRAAPPPPSEARRAAPERPDANGNSYTPSNKNNNSSNSAPAAAARSYTGPYLTPLCSGFQPLEGYPFGAPVSITMAESLRTKRHIMFESQLTSSQQSLWEVYRDPSVRVDASNSLANLLATIGTLPGPMQLASSIDASSVHTVAGASVVAKPSGYVELTSGQEALRLFANVAMDWTALQLVVNLRAQSMLEEALSQVIVRLRPKGAAWPAFAGPAAWSIKSLEGLEVASHSMRLFITGSGALTLQPDISHRAPAGVARDGGGYGDGSSHRRLEVVTASLRVPITLQLKAPRVPLTAEGFFQRFHTWHHTCTVSGTCIYRGAEGGLAVLDIIEKKAFRQTYLKLLPSLGGFQAAYLAYDATNRAVGLAISAQLALVDRALSPLTANASDMAAASHCVFRVTVRTGAAGAAASMAAAPASWLQELTDGAVCMSVASVQDAASVARPPLLSNGYAHMAVQFRKDLTPDPKVKEVKEEGEKEGEGGMTSAAAGLAAFAQAQADAKAAKEAKEAEGEEEQLRVEEVPEQTGDDWLHMAVLSMWQQRHGVGGTVKA